MDFAFPQPHEWTTGGLTKREYLAAKAMQGILTVESGYGSDPHHHEFVARFAVKYADALIAELNKGEKP